MARDKNWILIEDGTGFQKWILKDKWTEAQRVYKEMQDNAIHLGLSQATINQFQLRIVKEGT